MFNNLMIYRLLEAFPETPESLSEKLSQFAFKPCGSHDESISGFVAPIGEELVFSQGGRLAVCLQTESKVMPAAAINKLVAEKMEKFESENGKRANAKERASIKDEVIFNALPTALTVVKQTLAYIDTVAGFIVVDASSQGKAEDVLTYLRRCLGTLPCTPLNTKDMPRHVLTSWITDLQPNGATLGMECTLEGEEKARVKIKNIDLHSAEVDKHLQYGHQVTQIAVEFDNRLSFVINENLEIKRLKFIGEITDNQDVETAEQRFDADFFLMTGEIKNLIEKIIEWLGGVN
jgi:recombination associated protein RdgC